MAFVDDFKEMFTVTITHSPLVSRDTYGKPTFGPPTSYKARVVRENKLVRNAEGEQVVSTSHIWIQGVPTVSPEDLITLEDGVKPKILNVPTFQDEHGPSHTTVYFL